MCLYVSSKVYLNLMYAFVLTTAGRYFTASVQESVSLDTTGYTSLKDIFLKPSKLCLHNHESNYGKHCFSNFTIAIFQ